MQKETIIWAVTREELQEMAEERIGRLLSEEEMEYLVEEVIYHDNLMEMQSILFDLIKDAPFWSSIKRQINNGHGKNS